MTNECQTADVLKGYRYDTFIVKVDYIRTIMKLEADASISNLTIFN